MDLWVNVLQAIAAVPGIWAAYTLLREMRPKIVLSVSDVMYDKTYPDRKIVTMTIYPGRIHYAVKRLEVEGFLVGLLNPCLLEEHKATPDAFPFKDGPMLSDGGVAVDWEIPSFRDAPTPLRTKFVISCFNLNSLSSISLRVRLCSSMNLSRITVHKKIAVVK